MALTVVRFAFFQAVFGLSMDPNDSNEDSESVSISAKVRSPILKFQIEFTEKMNIFFREIDLMEKNKNKIMYQLYLEILLMEDFRSSTDPPLYIDELQE